MSELHFIPWFRTGLANLSGLPAGAEETTLSIATTLSATRIADGETETQPLAQRVLRLLGPDAVARLGPGEILRRDPAPDAVRVEPNYFASVELQSADLPWRFTPGGPDSDGRLTPWLGLVVVEDRPGVSLTPATTDGLARLEIADDHARELPPIRDAWAWAHVQYEGTLEGGTGDVARLEAAFEARSPELRARLVCPRRLDPLKRYTACLVPLTLAGRQAGLGHTGGFEPGPAWDDAGGAITLPVYDHWGFSTGERGDFEALVRILTPGEAEGEIGLRPLDVAAPGSGLTEGTEPVLFGGALVSPGGFARLQAQEAAARAGANPTLPEEIGARVRAALDVPGGRAPKSDPVVAPPAYGLAYRRPDRTPGDEPLSPKDPAWFATLNTRPEHRVVAGIGASEVRRHQEELLDAAWDAAGAIVEVNTQLNLSRMAVEVGEVAAARFAGLGDADRLRLSAPAFDAIPGKLTPTVGAQLHASAIPNGLLSGAARRITRRATGLAADGASPTPGSDVVAGVLADPVSGPGAYRDAVAPAGLAPGETPAPRFRKARNRLDLAHPQSRKRGRTRFDREPGTDGLIGAVTAAQDPQALLGRSLRARIPALGEAASDPVPPALPLAPRFGRPAYQRLRETSLDLIVPGIGTLPTNSLSLLYANPLFVRAFLAGMNHEMGREFLWREFPTPLSATWFHSFWRSGADDIPAIATWGDTSLAGADTAGPADPTDVVLVIRGELPRRFPNLRLYAIAARYADGSAEESDLILPAFAGQFAADIFFFGFSLSVPQIRGDGAGNPGHFFVFEEVPSAPRFGLEVALPDEVFGAAPGNWQTINWANVTPAGNDGLARFVDLQATGWMAETTRRVSNGPGTDAWAEDSASFARQTLQRPARILVHGSAMLPGPGQDQ